MGAASTSAPSNLAPSLSPYRLPPRPLLVRSAARKPDEFTAVIAAVSLTCPVSACLFGCKSRFDGSFAHGPNARAVSLPSDLRDSFGRMLVQPTASAKPTLRLDSPSGANPAPA